MEASIETTDTTTERRHPRVEADFPVLLEHRGSWLLGQVRNISVGGLFVRCDESRPEPGQPFGLMFQIPDRPQVFYLASEVVWIGHDVVRPDHRLSFGLRFVRPNDDATLAIERLVTARRESEGPLEPPIGRSYRRRPRVLLVDDEAPTVRSLSRILIKLGCSVDSARDGTAALRLLERNQYTLAIVDVVLPGLDGMSLTARMREQKPDLRVVVISGHAGEEFLDEAFRAGADDVLCKPFDLEHVRHVLMRYACSATAPQPVSQA